MIEKQGALTAIVNVYLRDPLENSPDENSLELRPYDTAGGQVYLGWDIKGSDVYLNTLGYSGALISGAPNAGKTVLVKRIAAELALSDVAVSIANGKNDSKFDVFKNAGISVIGDDKPIFLEQLRERERLRQERMRSLPGDYQDQPVDSQPPLEVLIVDEFQEYLSAVTRDERPVVEEITALLTRLIKLQRSAGMFTILATQKVDSQAIPTALRDVIPSKISGYTTTPEMTRMALGNLRDDEPHPDDKHVVPPGKPGRMIIAGQAVIARLFQVANINDEQIIGAIRGGVSVSGSRQ
ncbi:MAG: AAA family ATPase [Bifidobacterium sp.]|uniref:AAA family ATPase n=1 Tax=Bifidobacterium fermentum TaxID=3059035 RepID=A0AB39UME3_9BIFI